MATFTETMTREQAAAVENAAALHNAQINERYLRLKNAIDEQFEEVKAEAYAPRASVLAPEKPVETVAPETVEFTHTRVDSPLFTAETLDRTLERNAVAEQETVLEMPTAAPTMEVAPAYSLNMSAVKKAVAAFVGTVAVMLTAIGINTQIINANEAKIAMIEQRNAAVVAEIAELQQQIAIAESEETIAAFAQANGMVKAD